MTAFRLLEQLAAGRAADVDRYLAWAAGEKLTILRVLAMAKHLFDLPPDRGRAHLPDLLQRAARHGLYVEIVALADTADIPVSIEEQVKAIGDIAARHPNAVVEIANEPYHPTQRESIRSVAALERLLPLIPEAVPVALGAVERADESRAADFATFHFPRSDRDGGWGHVRELVPGHAAMRRLEKPLINDEPIGAGAGYQPGRRDDSPDRFRAAALLTRMMGLGGTFHYEGGLNATIPEGRELELFKAWQEAWQLLPGDIEHGGMFRALGDAGAAAAGVESGKSAGAWEVQRGDSAWLLAIGTEDLRPRWADGWREAESVSWRGSRWWRAARIAP